LSSCIWPGKDGTFADRSAFERWRTTEPHRNTAERMAELADWWVGD
jgi:hypothetical protein